MVVAVALIFLISILFAPQRGVLSRLRSHYQSRHKMTLEHILKVLFKYGQEKQRWGTFHPIGQIMQMWSFTASELRRGLRQLTREGMLSREGDMFCLTETGREEGARVLRRHRLWEVYLTRYLDLPHDHVHRDAEEIEHILTPELERRLEELLEHPTHDPHKQEIPYIGEERKS
jgi:manganese/zinc/iron transport system permease protein